MFWLLPAAAPAAAEAAVAATVAIGSAAYIGADVLGFRRGGLPPATGQAPGEVTVAEAVREMVRGALVPNSQTGNLFPQPPPINELLLLSALAQLGKWAADRLDIGRALGQIWGLLGGNKRQSLAFNRDDISTWPVNPGGLMYYSWGIFNARGEYMNGPHQGISKPVFTGYGWSNSLGDPLGEWHWTHPNGTEDGNYAPGNAIFRLNSSSPWGSGSAQQPTTTTGSGFFPAKAIPTATPKAPPAVSASKQAKAQAPAASVPVIQPAPAGTPAAPKHLPLIQTPAQAAALQQLVRAYQLPSATRLTSAGSLPAAAPAAAAQTGTQARTYGPVTINTTAPRATLEGIAEEVGRVEQKLGELLNPNTNNQPDWLEKLRQLWDLMNAINNILQAQGAGGSYTASSPCVTDSQGQRIVTEVEFEGANDQLGVIRNRIDALADLMQKFKDLRQPICKGAPTSNVTVTAYEISQE